MMSETSTTKPLPVHLPEFWRKRLVTAHATGKGLHSAIYDTDPDTWEKVQKESKRILGLRLHTGQRVLDAGCGYGALSEVLPDGVYYLGVDISPDLVEIAQERYPDRQFMVCNFRRLNALADGSYDLAVCRSIRKMLTEQLGEDTWKVGLRELLRVAGRVLVMEYEDLPHHQILIQTPVGILQEDY